MMQKRHTRATWVQMKNDHFSSKKKEEPKPLLEKKTVVKAKASGSPESA